MLTAPRGAARAGGVIASLRRGGFAPIPLALPDASPATGHLGEALSAARRTGATWVVGVGSCATLNVARALAALLTAGSDAAAAVARGAAPTLTARSAPLLVVPTCAGAAEFTREAILLAEGGALTAVRTDAASEQAALIDPSLAATLTDEPAFVTAFAVIAHAAEAVLRADGTSAERGRAWFALELAARALRSAARGGTGSDAEAARAAIAVASALTSGALASGPLGPARGTALAVATRYSISYAAALAALAPTAIGALVDPLISAYEEVAENEVAADEARRSAPPVPRSGAGSGAPARPWTSPSRGAAFGAEQRVTPRQKGGAASEVRPLGVGDAVFSVDDEVPLFGEDQDSAIVLSLRRYAAVGRLLEDVAAGAPSASAAAPWARLEDVLMGVKLNARGRADAALVGPALASLRAVGAQAAGLRGGAPVLADFGLTDADFSAIADVAEVDDNTMTSLVPLRKSDIVGFLEKS